MAYALFYHFECATDQVLDLWFPGFGFWERGSGVRSRFLGEEAPIH